jgi:hypothetical protein
MGKRYLKYLRIRRNVNEDDINEYKPEREGNRETLLNSLKNYTVPIISCLTPMMFLWGYCYEMGYTNYFNVSSEYIETNLNVIAIDLICFSLFLMGMYILDYFLKFQFERIRIDFYKSVIVIDIILNSYLFSGVIVIIEIMLLSNLNFIVPIVSTILMMIGQGIVLYRNNSRWFYNNSETIFSFSSKYIIRSVESFIVMFIYFFINPQYRKEVSNIQYGWVLTILFVLWISVFSSLIATIFEQRMNGNEWINKTENTDFSSIFKHTDSSAILRRLLAGLVVLIITLSMSVFSTFGNLFARYTFPKRYTVYQVDNVIAQFFGGSNETSKKTFSKDKEEYYLFYVVYENKDSLCLKPIQYEGGVIINLKDSKPDETTTYVVNKSKVDVVYTFSNPKEVTESLKNDGFTISN